MRDTRDVAVGPCASIRFAAVPKIALTIDTEFPDRPSAEPLGVCRELLKILGEQRVQATFFIVGCWAKANPQLVKAISQAGHSIGNHGYSHCDLEWLSPRGVARDISECRGALADLGVETRPWFRAPYGSMGKNGGRIYKAVEAAGYRYIGWHAHGRDWAPGSSADRVIRDTVKQVRKRWPEPAIALFHSWPDLTPAVVSGVIDQLRGHGAEFVTVPELG